MIVGIHVDGWAHQDRDLNDSITTPWHALFYSGFAVAAAWIVWVCFDRRGAASPRDLLQGSRSQRLARIPMGYGLGLVGVATFLAGGVGDQIWHLSLGVEQDLEAFLSPTHWLLAAGMFMMFSSPLRAAWTSFDNARPAFREFLPTLWSITLTVGMITFAYNYLSPFSLDNVTIEDSELFVLFGQNVSFETQYALAERLRMQGVANALIWTVLVVSVALLVLRRWRPPFSSFTVVYGATAAGASAVWDFDLGWTLVAAVAAGVAADLFARRIAPGAITRTQARVFGAVVPFVLWATYIATLAAAYDIGWTTPMWAGLVIFSVPVGVLVSFLMVPMAVSAAPGLPGAAVDGAPARVELETTRELEGTAL